MVYGHEYSRLCFYSWEPWNLFCTGDPCHQPIKDSCQYWCKHRWVVMETILIGLINCHSYCKIKCCTLSIISFIQQHLRVWYTIALTQANTSDPAKHLVKTESYYDANFIFPGGYKAGIMPTLNFGNQSTTVNKNMSRYPDVFFYWSFVLEKIQGYPDNT